MKEAKDAKETKSVEDIVPVVKNQQNGNVVNEIGCLNDGSECNTCSQSTNRCNEFILRHTKNLSQEDLNSYTLVMEVENNLLDNGGFALATEKPKRKNYSNCELNIKHWDCCNIDTVECIPYDIDGLCKYKIECTLKDMMSVTKDGRRWNRWATSSRKFFNGTRRVARCKGSPRCSSESCLYLKSHSLPNRIQFQKDAGKLVCFTCGSTADNIPCPAVKIWEYDGTSATIFHKGIHTCVVKAKKVSKQEVVKLMIANPTVKPNKLINDKMVQIMTVEDFNWTEVASFAENFADAKRLYNIREEVKGDINPLGHNFEALAVFKAKCDEKDKYLIYQVNNRGLNGKPSYVFKSSLAMAN